MDSFCSTTPSAAVGELEERARLYLGLPPDPESEDLFAFRWVEDGTLVLVGLGEF